MDDDLRMRLGEGAADSLRVEHVEHDRLRPERAKIADLPRGPRRSDHLVPLGCEQWNESLSDRSRGACNEDPHDLAPLFAFVL